MDKQVEELVVYDKLVALVELEDIMHLVDQVTHHRQVHLKEIMEVPYTQIMLIQEVEAEQVLLAQMVLMV